MFKSFDRPVKCKEGHLFTTIWMPFGSFKAVRLANYRYQYCPVGHHWTSVMRLDQNLTDSKTLQKAAAVHDIRIP